MADDGILNASTRNRSQGFSECWRTTISDGVNHAQLAERGARGTRAARPGRSLRSPSSSTGLRQLVVLNACYTRVQAEALVAHVPCVIGMPGSHRRQVCDRLRGRALSYQAQGLNSRFPSTRRPRAHDCGARPAPRGRAPDCPCTPRRARGSRRGAARPSRGAPAAAARPGRRRAPVSLRGGPAGRQGVGDGPAPAALRADDLHDQRSALTGDPRRAQARERAGGREGRDERDCGAGELP